MDTAGEVSADELQNRAIQYQTLASFFLTLPDKDSLKAVKEQLQEGIDDDSVGLQELTSFFAQEATIDEAMVTAVAADRTYLVRGTTKQGPRPPYGSLYANADPGASMISLKARYRNLGFEQLDDVHEAADYLGVELAFAACLLDCAAGEVDKEKRAAQVQSANDFIRICIVPFACAYAAEALTFARTLYCQGMLHLLDEFMQAEQDIV